MVVGLESVKSTSFLKGVRGGSFLGGCFSFLFWRPRYFHLGWVFCLLQLSVPHGAWFPSDSLLFSNIGKAGTTTSTALVTAINAGGKLVQAGSSHLQQQAIASGHGAKPQSPHATASVTAVVAPAEEPALPQGKPQTTSQGAQLVNEIISLPLK